ncbi:MAG TPA: DUF5924 family protein, partial [Nevskiaceae bacterium]|nr:DUF5924 family protein [Nevskiaceae bacterium]
LDRRPWLLPAASFAFGWLSFALVQRGERLASIVAILALIGWPWIFFEAAMGRLIVARSKGRLSIGAVRFVTQQIEQEILFFALPFLFTASPFVPGQIVFLALASGIALLTTLDPIYYHRIAPHAGLASALHAYCTFIAALVVLPIAAHLPADKALPVAMGFTVVTLAASVPRMLAATEGTFKKLAGLFGLPLVLAMGWNVRNWIPPAGLWVREARITDRVENLQPGERVARLSAATLTAQGLHAFVAVRAPQGLSQAVVFEWRWKGVVVDRIPAQVSGGREEGFRTYSRKQNFPADPRGGWIVDLKTPAQQVVARMRFEVE